jgi:hypothetical protein
VLTTGAEKTGNSFKTRLRLKSIANGARSMLCIRK